jgi:hypothetical protein
MKALLPMLMLAAAVPAESFETTKELVSMSVKLQKLGGERDRYGRWGESGEKTVTLRVEIRNTSSAPLEGASVSATALIFREGERSESIRREAVEAVELPSMKPNEKITVDLGKIVLREYEFGGRKTEESLEEWSVVCTQGETKIGTDSTKDYSMASVKEAQQKEPDGRGFPRPEDWRDRLPRRR